MRLVRTTEQHLPEYDQPLKGWDANAWFEIFFKCKTNCGWELVGINLLFLCIRNYLQCGAIHFVLLVLYSYLPMYILCCHCFKKIIFIKYFSFQFHACLSFAVSLIKV